MVLIKTLAGLFSFFLIEIIVAIEAQFIWAGSLRRDPEKECVLLI